jgi:hypothetical protein
VGAGGKRATNDDLEASGTVLAGEQENVEHLPRGLRGPVALGELPPQLIEASGPAPAPALLVQRERPGERAGGVRAREALAIQRALRQLLQLELQDAQVII